MDSFLGVNVGQHMVNIPYISHYASGNLYKYIEDGGDIPTIAIGKEENQTVPREN